MRAIERAETWNSYTLVRKSDNNQINKKRNRFCAENEMGSFSKRLPVISG